MTRRALTAICVAITACVQTTPFSGAGFRLITTRDPWSGRSMDGVVVFPSADTVSTTVGPYVVAAHRDAAPTAGRFPLIVLSPGTGGSRWDLHDLATGLARRGFVVASLTHPGDNFQDHSGVGTDRVLVGRELQLEALIGAVFSDSFVGPHIDASRIGAAGFSAGGYTALVLAGARPDFSLKDPYCLRHPESQDFCGWEVSVTRPAVRPSVDTRVAAVFAMAPVGVYFDQAALAGIRAPVRIWAGDSDRVLPFSDNAARLASLVPHSAGVVAVAQAGHYVFLGPCSATFAVAVPTICNDPPGVDRVAIHRRLVEDAARFFGRALGAGSRSTGQVGGAK